MNTHVVPEFTGINAAAAVMIGMIYIMLSSLIKEPERQKVSAIIAAGAGGVYWSGGLGAWEFVFGVVMVYVAYRGLRSYVFIGIAWMLHVGWDVMHHLYADPIVVFSPTSSAGCAVCDTVMALWFFFGAPNVFQWLRRSKKLALPN